MNSQHITLKLSPQKLAELFRLGVLCASDVGCVDTQGRDLIQQLCLQSCVKWGSKSCEECQAKCHHTGVNVLTNTTVPMQPIKLVGTGLQH